jgi:hypothetical protein
VSELLERAIAHYQQAPLYWAGVILWLLGFAAYVPACCGRGRLVLSQAGIVLCSLGFAVTLLAYFVLDGRCRVPNFERRGRRMRRRAGRSSSPARRSWPRYCS